MGFCARSTLVEGDEQPYRPEVWPDLANFCHFDPTIKHFCRFERVGLVFATIMSLFWHICYAIRQIFIDVNSQILNKSSGHTAYRPRQ